ncbi:MAG TPA: hypothetical protein VN721_13570 [Flavipsychrobacter sp.]|nr:hypothetical protein [Flavipsychrobacter sp.]
MTNRCSLKYVILIIALCIKSPLAHSQNIYNYSQDFYNNEELNKKEDKPDLKHKITWGTGVILGPDYVYLNNDYYFGLSPMIGYHITNNLMTGVEFGYIFEQSKNVGSSNSAYQSRATLLFPGLWSRYIFWKSLYAVGTFDYNFMQYSYYYHNSNNKPDNIRRYSTDESALLFGIGFKQSFSDKTSIITEALYDVLQQKNSFYWGHFDIRASICADF